MISIASLLLYAHCGKLGRQRCDTARRDRGPILSRSKSQDHFRKLARELEGVGGTDAQIRLTSLPVPGPAVYEDSSDETAERRLLSRGLELIRDEFEDRTWNASLRTTVERRDTKDVALELEMSPGAVRVAKSRVLRRLREELVESS